MNLFETQARTNDPGTSHEAARNHRELGRMSENCEIVRMALLRNGPSTGCELHEFLNDPVKNPHGKRLDRTEVSRRLSDCEKLGAVKRSGQRKCSVKGNTQTLWYVPTMTDAMETT